VGRQVLPQLALWVEDGHPFALPHLATSQNLHLFSESDEHGTSPPWSPSHHCQWVYSGKALGNGMISIPRRYVMVKRIPLRFPCVYSGNALEKNGMFDTPRRYVMVKRIPL